MLNAYSHVLLVLQLPVTSRGLDLKRLIIQKQEALMLPTIPLKFMLLFVHELGGRSCSPFIGREVRGASL